jgi:hypothetical protein
MNKADFAVSAFLHMTWPNAMGVFLPVLGQNLNIHGFWDETVWLCHKEHVRMRRDGDGTKFTFTGKLGPEGRGDVTHLQHTRFGREMDWLEGLAKERLAVSDDFYSALYIDESRDRFKIGDEWHPFRLTGYSWDIRAEIVVANAYIRRHKVPATALGRAIADMVAGGNETATAVAAATKVVEAAKLATRVAEIEAKLAKYGASGDVADLAGLI